MVYSRKIDERDYTFGVSGRLYKSNVLLYDHQTDSLWSQLMEKAIAGPRVGTRLTKISSVRISWQAWQKRNPDALVLSTETGYQRDYTRDPYTGYYNVGSIWFPVGNVRQDLSPKDRVLGVEINNQAKAYPLDKLCAHPGIHIDRIGQATIRIEVNAAGEVIAIMDQQGKPVPHIYAYWFAWQAFHPRTAIYRGVK